MLIIKHLRRKKNMSQTDLANAIDVSLRTIQLYEKKNANIPIKNLTKIAQHFEMGIDQLFAREVNESDINYRKSNRLKKKGHRISKLAPGKYLVEAPLIITKRQMEYIEKQGSDEFLNTLLRVGFVVEQVSVSDYLAFEISNSSMDNGLVTGIPAKAVVLGKQTSKMEVAKRTNESNINWVIVHEDSVMCKKIAAYDKKNEVITCHSLNKSPEFPDFELKVDDIKAFFRIIKKQVD